jgi:hypothetical protein
VKQQTALASDQPTLTAAVCTIVLATFTARYVAASVSSIDWDEGVYIVMAQRWLHGELPYVAIWDQHPPGLPALLAIVQTIVPDPVVGAHVLASAAVAATAVLLHRFCAVHANQPGAGLLSALLYIVCISRWSGLSANTEVFNNAFVTFGAYSLLGAARCPRSGRFPAMQAAMVLGIGLQVKYVVFPEATLLCLGYLLALYRKGYTPADVLARASLLILAGCLPSAVALGYFWFHGALQPFIGANVGSNLAYLGITPSVSESVRSSASGIAPVAGCILVMVVLEMIRARRWRPHRFADPALRPWILLWAAAAALDVCMPLKFSTHYFFALYPPLCLGGALALAALAQRRHEILAVGAVALLLSAAPPWLIGMTRAARSDDTPRMIAERLRDAGAGDRDVYVYDYQPAIYALAHVAAPTPFVLTGELGLFSQSAGSNGADEMRRVMSTRPRFVVVRSGPSLRPDLHAADDIDGIIRAALGAYRLAYSLSDQSDDSVVSVYELS